MLAKYSNLKRESKPPTLVIKLARETIFGDDIMRKSAAGQELPGLPKAELQLVKQTIFKNFQSTGPTLPSLKVCGVTA